MLQNSRSSKLTVAGWKSPTFQLEFSLSLKGGKKKQARILAGISHRRLVIDCSNLGLCRNTQLTKLNKKPLGNQSKVCVSCSTAVWGILDIGAYSEVEHVEVPPAFSA